MKTYDFVEQIIEFEEGCLTEEETVALFQNLLDTGVLYSLQGFYQRTASRLIDAGLIGRRIR